MAEISAGSLYDLNKNLMLQREKPLSLDELRQRISEVIPSYINSTENMYYMLLCHERRDYTLFKIPCGVFMASTIKEDMYDCLYNRGRTLSIEPHEAGGIEIWIKIDGEAFCYYFFPYDVGVIDCGGH